MSLILRFGIENTATCKAINLFDGTGDSTVTGGYGNGGNPVPSDFNAAAFKMTGQLSGIDKTINVYPTLPSNDPTVMRTITNTDLGLTGDIPMDIFFGVYTLLFTAPPHLPTIASGWFWTSCQSFCCLDNINAQIRKCGGCDDKTFEELSLKAIKIAALIQSITTALSASCDDLTDAVNNLKELKKLCGEDGCGCN